MSSVIYKIINLVNDKFYVGSTTNKKVRFREHRKQLRGNRHHCKHLQASWNKYGEDKFIFKVVEEISDPALLSEAEDRWLSEHFGKPYCYNSGAAAIAPWRGVYGKNHPNFGRPRTEEDRQAISTTLKEFYAEDITNHPRFGKTHTEETKERIRQAKLANPTRAWLGKERSAETKEKISAAQKGVKKGARTYTPEGLERARENMRRHAKKPEINEFAKVLAKFPQEVRDRYDFTNAVYTGALVRITGVVCPDHGEFSNYAARFRKGFGCPLCGRLVRAAKKKEEMLRVWATEEGRKMFMEPRKNSLDTPAQQE